MRLSDLKINQCAMIASVQLPNEKSNRRMMEMGVVPYTKIQVTKKAPMKGPMGIFLRGYELCMSREEASCIKVEVMQ